MQFQGRWKRLNSPVAMLMVAVVYFLAAWPGLQVVIAPKLPTALWISAGIAVAATLRWGYRIWPGVWLGAMAVSLAAVSVGPLASVATSGAIAAGVATGCTLQAIVGPRDRRTELHPGRGGERSAGR